MLVFVEPMLKLGAIYMFWSGSIPSRGYESLLCVYHVYVYSKPLKPFIATLVDY
jgi:hypothetical protein